MAGRMINGAAALADLIRPGGTLTESEVYRALPVIPELSGLLPSRGLRRGTTVAISAASPEVSGGTSLLLALLSATSRAGSWCAVVGIPALGALAAAESGIELERLALVPHPGPDWLTVVAALIDGVDVVVVAVPGTVAPAVAGRLTARARQRGCVLIPYGQWPGADLTLRVTRGTWHGLGAGHGRLRRREVTITAHGRGAAAKPKEITLWLPGITTAPPLPPAPETRGRQDQGRRSGGTATRTENPAKPTAAGTGNRVASALASASSSALASVPTSAPGRVSASVAVSACFSVPASAAITAPAPVSVCAPASTPVFASVPIPASAPVPAATFIPISVPTSASSASAPVTAPASASVSGSGSASVSASVRAERWVGFVVREGGGFRVAEEAAAVRVRASGRRRLRAVRSA